MHFDTACSLQSTAFSSHLDNTGHIGAAVLTHFTGTQQGTKSATVLTGQLAKKVRTAEKERDWGLG
jgi:hypothetical protein